MEVTDGGAPEVPGRTTQEELQEATPMDLSAGADLSPQEQEAWEKSKTARAKELGLAIAADLAAATGPQGSPPRGRSSKAEGAEETSSLAPVREEGTELKVPSDGDAEEEAEEDEAEGATREDEL